MSDMPERTEKLIVIHNNKLGLSWAKLTLKLRLA